MNPHSRWKPQNVQTSPQLSHRAKAHLPPEVQSSASTWLAVGNVQTDEVSPGGSVQSRSLRHRYLIEPESRVNEPLRIDLAEILRTARSRIPAGSAILNFLRQAVSETQLLLRGIKIRLTSNRDATRSYLRITPEQLEHVNLRQAWANWRVIPKALCGNIPNRPLAALDLCCGIGQSTEVLAHYLPDDSAILGVDINPEFLSRAKNKHYQSKSGHFCRTEFAAGSVLSPFMDALGENLPGNSIDVVLCIGALGAHFDYSERVKVAGETWRVLRRGGVAIVDARGRKGREKTRSIFTRAGFAHRKSVSSCMWDRTSLEVFFKV